MFFDKLTKLNQRISYNLFAFNSYFLIFLLLILGYINGYVLEVFILCFLRPITLAIYSIVLIICCLEQIMDCKLPYPFVKHPAYSIFLLIGAILSSTYLIFILRAFLP